MIRLLLYGLPGTPVFEVGQRISEFHDLEFYTIEKEPFEGENYFANTTIPEITLDTGDMSSGSAQQQFVRDPASMEKDKILDEPCGVAIDSVSLSSSEIEIINGIDQGVICTEIPDTRLVDWSTHVIFFNASEKRAISWFSMRQKCISCGTVHHLEDKPSRYLNVCDRCGTDLITREEDSPASIRAQFMNWRQAFWRMKVRGEQQDKLNTYAVDKFESLDDIITRVNRDYRGYITKIQNWYNRLYKDRRGDGSGPNDSLPSSDVNLNLEVDLSTAETK